MNRIELIEHQKKELATIAGQKFLKQKKLNVNVKSLINTERNNLHTIREIKRLPFDPDLALERIINGTDESRDIAPNNAAAKFGIPVARLFDIARSSEPKGFATGFLIAPNILITNNHVFKTSDQAINCAANFGYEKDKLSNKIKPGSSFYLQPQKFFYTCPSLDFTLVYVEEKSINGDRSLTSLGLLKLIATKGKVKIKSPINIVQYPGGGIKKYTTEQNLVTDINDEDGYIFYTTDTLKGSSGSPCANSFWEVAALHSTSVPRVNAKGQWLTVDNEIVDKENTSDNEIDWIANAGISVSKIIEHLQSQNFNTEDTLYIQQILNLSTDPLEKKTNSNVIEKPIIKQEKNTMSDSITFNFYGNTTVYVNSNNGLVSSPEKQVIKLSADILEKKETFDEDYTSREGYDEDFLPDFKVPMPTASEDIEKELYKNFGTKKALILKYHHYSLVFSKERRMCVWTAANVNYSKKVRDDREREELGNGAWRPDPRIPTKYQITAEEFYDPATLVDKGHIVRRDDNVWWDVKINGGTKAIGIEYANADTFHWTNCIPQHEAFNRDMMQYKGVGLWGVLENAIKGQLEKSNDKEKDYNQCACVLAGPILKPNDPEYNGIQYPLAFWKIFAIHSETEGNLVYGFILSQEDKVEEMGLEKEGLPRWNAKVQAMRRSLEDITAASGIIFHQSLHDVDTMKGKVSNKPFEGSLE